MNTWQVLGQVQALLRAKKWEDTGEVVFHSESVIVTPGLAEDLYTRYQSPLAIISCGSGSSDAEEPSLLSTTLGVRLIVVSLGDARGEAALMGAHAKGSDQSAGRGLLEVETPMLETIALANGKEGIEIEFRATGQLRADLIDDRYVVARDYQFSLFCGAWPTFPAAAGMAALATGGVVSLGWEEVAPRYDLTGFALRRRAWTRPASPSDGDAVTINPDGVSASDTPTPGTTYHYGLWAAYAPYDNPNLIHYSGPVFAEVTV